MKKCENPLIPEITKTCKKRIFNLSSIKLPEGLKKKCVWCLGPLSGQQRRWCGEDCIAAASAWGMPQKEYGLGLLLIRQNFKCNICAFDWGTIVEAMYEKPRTPYGMVEAKDTWRTKFHYWLTVKLKEEMHSTDLPHRIEVDHIVPIHKGGQSLGLDNHQAICYTCHKVKTKIDNSGPRSTTEEKALEKKLKKNYDLINGRQGAHYRAGTLSPRDEGYYPYLESFWDSVTMEELDLYIQYFYDKYSEFSHIETKQRLESIKQKKLDKISKVSDPTLDENDRQDENGGSDPLVPRSPADDSE